MERNIRDVRDIFGRNASEASSRKQELRSYEYSPRSRRKFEAVEDWDVRPPQAHHDARSNSHKKERHRQPNPADFPDPVKQHKKADEKNGNSKSSNNSSNNKDSAYYANRTLTERDIRHLERHLSMKKTIRKQISRNLAQAFVDETELDLKDPIPTVQQKAGNKVDRTFTLTRAKVSKSEQNVLDLLKDNEPDSGHCSADNPNSSDDDSQQEQTRQRSVPRSSEKASGNSRPAADSNRNKSEQMYKEDGKFSFWKMFSVKNRGKR